MQPRSLLRLSFEIIGHCSWAVYCYWAVVGSSPGTSADVWGLVKGADPSPLWNAGTCSCVVAVAQHL